MWHQRIKPYLEAGTIQAFGLVEEQHPERTVLFSQWKEMDLPILVDPLNQIDVSAVPITLLYDEAGALRFRNPSTEQFEEFLRLPPLQEIRSVKIPGSEWSSLDAMALQGRFTDAIDGYGKQLVALGETRNEQDRARLHFRMGVAYRMRYDSATSQRRPTDFGEAIQHWAAALELNPNQYIWRRRIQQYGPVLDKPYPFYDWVDQARKEITARGGNPSALRVEPGGAELVGPAENPGDREPASSPDPEGGIARDEEKAIRVEQVLVPDTGGEKRGVRVHLVFEPNPLFGYAWNNEDEPLRVWVADARGKGRLYEAVNPSREATSIEPRKIEFEMAAARHNAGDSSASSGVRVTGYALYSVCHSRTGACSYRRQDFEISVNHVPPKR